MKQPLIGHFRAPLCLCFKASLRANFHENETACRTHFRIKGFALWLILKQRHTRTQKWSIELKRGIMKKYVVCFRHSQLTLQFIYWCFESSKFRYVPVVLLNHCVAPNFVDVRICQQFYPNKTFWNRMAWSEEEIHQQSPSWEFARTQNIIWWSKRTLPW